MENTKPSNTDKREEVLSSEEDEGDDVDKPSTAQNTKLSQNPRQCTTEKCTKEQ
jgi:hypothetical protein